MFNLGFMNQVNAMIAGGAATSMTDTEFLEKEIQKWKGSINRLEMIIAEKYYSGEHDILRRKRTIIGKNGELEEVENLPNNLIIDNQYAKVVDQKKNYLLGQPLTFATKNKNYEKALKQVFNKRFHRTFKNLGSDALNGGIAWLYPYYSKTGAFAVMKFAPYEVLPFWADTEHTVLDCLVRLYPVSVYEGKTEKIIEKVEVFKAEGLERYILEGGRLVPDAHNPLDHYITVKTGESEKSYNWGRVPVIPFRCNTKEIPLLRKVKSLQDGINIMLSDFENNMQEDARNTILVIENYAGQNLAEFRHNLATLGAVKVNSTNGSRGGVKTLTVEVNAENYEAILKLFKRALIENARGYDAKDERMSGTPNMMNIQSMYNDIDLDANEMETEFQSGLEELLWFINVHLTNTGQGDFMSEEVEVIFNRDMMMNEQEIMQTLMSAGVQISNETLLGQVPFINNVAEEQKRLKNEQKPEDDYINAFNPLRKNIDGDSKEALQSEGAMNEA